MGGSPVQKIESVLERCAQQPLERPNVWLLQRGCLLANLAQRTYDPAHIADASLEADLGHSCMPGVTPHASSAAPVGDCLAGVKATLLSGPPPEMPVHAIWLVPNLGVVVAFRGTAALQDIYADINFQPVQLSKSDIKLHGAIYSGAAKCIQHIQAVYYQAVQQGSYQEMPALYLTGHSLGGGYASCAFLDILASRNPMSAALLRGGAYTFGSPLVAFKHEELEYTAQAIQLLLLQEHQLPSGWAQLPLFNFVNGLDLVPRLLGQTSIHAFAQVLALMLPQTYNDLLRKTAAVAADFVPFGTYCLVLGDVVRVVNSAAKPELLQLTVQQLLGGAQQMGQDEASAPFVLQKLLSDHSCAAYTAALRVAVHSMVPVLFMGGQAADYQPMLVQRQSAAGVTQEVALKHLGTGVVSHNAFHEIPVRKVLMGIGAAAAGAVALKEVLESNGPKDVLTVVSTVAKGAGNFLSNDLTAARHAVGAMEAAVQDHIPSIGKVLSKSLVGTITSSAASCAASPILGVANLVTGLLNLGLTGYNTYQLRGISKLQKVMNDKLNVVDNKLDGISSELQVANKGIQKLVLGQGRADGKLDWIMRSTTEISYMCGAIMQGMDHLDLMLQSQATQLDTVVQYCQALQQNQQVLLQGQDILISGQKVLLEEVTNMHRSVLSGTDTLLAELKNLSMDNFREKVDVVTGLYMDLLKNESTQARQANLVEHACHLQACIKTWLTKIAPSTADRVAIRQPFVVVAAIAAIAWDTANAASAPVSNGRVFLQTGIIDAPERDEFSHRKEVIKQIDAEILALMQHSTLFSFATTFQSVMMRYVYLRRALQARASLDEVLPMTTDALPAGGVITYDAMDLMWVDGLDDIRSMLSSQVVSPAQRAPARWKCSTLDELQWYCHRKGFPLDAHTFQELPMVYTSDLLYDLGVAEEDKEAVVARLTVSSIPVLRKAVLPQFAEESVTLMADQLPDLHLLEKMQKGLMFARFA